MKFYKETIPSVDDIVIATIEKIGNGGIYVKLVEFDDIQGLISFNLASTRRVKNLRQVFKEGKKKFLRVVKVDKEYVDLTDRFVDSKIKKKKQKQYKEHQVVMQIIQNVCRLGNYEFNDIAEKTVWKMKKSINFNDNEFDKYPYHFFENLRYDPNFINSYFDLNNDEKKLLLLSIDKYIKKIIYQMNCVFELTYFGFEGIQLIKNKLSQVKEFQIKFLSGNKYSVIFNGENKDKLVEKINDFKEKLKDTEGSFRMESLFITNNINEIKEDILENKYEDPSYHFTKFLFKYISH